jgi:hypothetical protein
MATQLLVLPPIKSIKLDIGKQCLYRFFWILCVLKSITQSITKTLIKKKASRKHNFNSIYTAHFKQRSVVRKGSIYRTGVVLKIKVNLYSYRMWCGISHFQNYYSIPKSTQVVNSSQTLLPRPRYFNLDHIMFFGFWFCASLNNNIV